MKNIFYFKKICALGGTEQFLKEVAEKYQDWDITVYFDEADEAQLERLRKFVRCRYRIPGEKVECDRAFFNFNIDMIDDVEAKENFYAFVSHANFEELGYKPPIQHPKLTHFIGVSDFATKKIEGYGKMLGLDFKATRCYNPLTLEPKEKVIVIVSACRLNDPVKGGIRTRKLVEALDKYATEHKRHYVWLIFSREPNVPIESKNVVIMQPRTDVRPYIQMADLVAQLSNDMETYCYTLNEAWGYGIKTISTPLTVKKELPIPPEADIELEYDCSNIEEVVRRIFEEPIKEFKYEPPKDDWDKLLSPGKSTYQEEKKMKYLVVATNAYERKHIVDKAEGRIIKSGEQFIVDGERLETLLGNNPFKMIFVKVISPIEEEPKIETATPEKKTVAKKSTKNVKKRPIQK